MQAQLNKKQREGLDRRVIEKILKDTLHFSTKDARYTRNAMWNNFERTERDWFQIELGDDRIILQEPRFVIAQEYKTTIVCQGHYPPGRRDQIRIFHLTRDHREDVWSLSDEPIAWLDVYTRELADA